MGAGKTERIHVTVSPTASREIDAYRVMARLLTRSDAMRRLVRLALEPTPAPEHQDVLKRIVAYRARLDVDLDDLVDKPNLRIHLALTQGELLAIKEFERAGGFETLCDAVRSLLDISLSGRVSKTHIKRLESMRPILQH